MKNETTIEEVFELPSLGKLNNIDGKFSLRSMTTMEEKKRLGINGSSAQFKIYSEILNDCLMGENKFDTYDLCLGDFQYLLFKLRTVTYGSIYPVTIMCPKCRELEEIKINLDELEVEKWSDEFDSKLYITLPNSKKQVKLRPLTPRLLDNITFRAKEIQAKTKELNLESLSFIPTIMAQIDLVDGEKLNEGKLQKFVESLSAFDALYIQTCAEDLAIGLKTDSIFHICNKCNNSFTFQLPITGSFLRPRIDR